MITISFLPVLRRSCREDKRSRGQLTPAMEGLERWDLSAVGAAEAWIQKGQFPFTPSRRDHTTIPPRPSSQGLQGYSPRARAYGAQVLLHPGKGAHPRPSAAAGSATWTSGGEALLTICVELSGNCSSACTLSKWWAREGSRRSSLQPRHELGGADGDSQSEPRD